MPAERDPMTLDESFVPALGSRSGSDEAPRAGRAKPTPGPEVVAKPTRRQFTAQSRLRILGEAVRSVHTRSLSDLPQRSTVTICFIWVLSFSSNCLASGKINNFK